jgi:hypothetical protein
MSVTVSATFADLLARAITEPGRIHAAYTAFHGYSIGNRMLAYAQCDARKIPIGPIATFMGWKDKGRFVRKGEKAIQLCMPVTGKRAGETQADGTEGDAVVYTRFIYRNNWFVLSQTDGDDCPLPTLPDWQADRALAALDVTRIAFAHTDGNCQGYAVARTIAVSPVAALPHKTFFHELAHVLLGHTAENMLSDGDDRTPRNIREVEAESVALVCCEAQRLPGAEYCRGYIQEWAKGNPIDERSAQRIFKAADQILKAGADVAVQS